MIIEIMRGDTPTLTFDVTRDGNAISLDSFSMYFVASETAGSGSYLFNDLCSNDANVVGRTSVTLSTLDAATVGSYIAELSGEINSGTQVLTFGQWELRVTQDVLL